MTTVNKFIVGDKVKHTLEEVVYAIKWIDYNDSKAGIVRTERVNGLSTGKTVPLAELEMVEPSVHIDRPLKPISKMSKEELRKHVRLLREGRREVFVNTSLGKSGGKKKKKAKKKKRKKKKKKQNKLDKLRKKYPDLNEEKLKSVAEMGEDWAEKFIPGFSKKED